MKTNKEPEEKPVTFEQIGRLAVEMDASGKAATEAMHKHNAASAAYLSAVAKYRRQNEGSAR